MIFQAFNNIGQPNIDNIIQILIISEQSLFVCFFINCDHIKWLFDNKKNNDVTCTRILITSRIITAKALIKFLESFSLILQN
jgi:hypothetical protein